MGARVLSANSPLSDLLGRPLVRVPADASLADVARTMRRANVSAVMVGHGDLIATERDLTRGLAAGLNPEALVVAVAGPSPIRVLPETTIIDAAAIMLNEEVRHLVVALPDHEEGIVSMRDLMAVLLQTASPHLWLTTLRLAIGVTKRPER
jgi:CBS domain-containing protein